MMDETVATLTGKIKFDADTGPLSRMLHMMEALDRKAKALQRNMQKFTLDGRANKAATAQMKQQFAAQMAQSKFTLAQAQSQTKLQTAQARQQLAQLKVAQQQKALAVQAIKAQQQAGINQLRQQGQTLANQLKATRLADLQARIAARHAKAQTQAAASAAAGPTGLMGRARNLFHGGGRGAGAMGGRMAHNSGGFGRSASLGGFGSALRNTGVTAIGTAGGGSLLGLAGAAGGAALAIAAMTVAATNFAAAAERSANAESLRHAQFKATTGSDEGAKGMESRYQVLANDLGLDSREGGRDYAKLTGALAKKGGVPQAEATARGIMSYGKAQGMTGEEMKNMNRGLLQALGKNQLYSEEWTGQISEHLGANANLYGAEAYQRAIGGNKTGQAAADQFMKDRTDKKIKGDVLQKFIKELGSVLGQHANDGGALDVAKQSQESRRARFNNQMNQNLTHAYNNSGLVDAMAGAYDNAQSLLKALGPQFDKFATWSSDVLKIISLGMSSAKDFLNAFNSDDKSAMDQYIDPKSVESFNTACLAFKESVNTLLDTLSGGTVTTLFGTQKEWSAFFSTTMNEFAFIMRGISQIADGFTWMINKVRAMLGLDAIETPKDRADALAKPIPVYERPNGISMLVSSGKTQEGPYKVPTPEATRYPQPEPLVVPQLPSLLPPAMQQGMSAMSVPSMTPVSPPVVQPVTNNSTTTVTNHVTVQPAKVEINGTNLTPEQIAGALGDKYQTMAAAAIQKTLQEAEAAQVKRY